MLDWIYSQYNDVIFVHWCQAYKQSSILSYATYVLQMDPGQDLLLAALSESGICPNDIGQFDVDAQDVAQPSTTLQVRW